MWVWVQALSRSAALIHAALTRRLRSASEMRRTNGSVDKIKLAESSKLCEFVSSGRALAAIRKYSSAVRYFPR